MTSQNQPGVRDIPPRLRFAVPARVRWGSADVGWAIGALVLTLLIGALVAASGIAYDANALQFALGLAGYALIAGVIVLASFRKGQRSLTKDFGLAIRPIDVLIGLGVGIAARLLSTIYVLLTSVATQHTPAAGNFTLSTQPVWIVLNGLLLASLVAPFVEELLLRGLVLQTVRNIVLRWRNREQPAEVAQQRRALWTSSIVSAIIFMLLHAEQSADATVVIALALTTFTLGLANAWLVFATGRLGAGIVAHVVFNGSSIAVALIASGLQ